MQVNGSGSDEPPTLSNRERKIGDRIKHITRQLKNAMNTQGSAKCSRSHRLRFPWVLLGTTQRWVPTALWHCQAFYLISLLATRSPQHKGEDPHVTSNAGTTK